MSSLKSNPGGVVKALGESTLIVMCWLMTLIINKMRLSTSTRKHVLLNNGKKQANKKPTGFCLN